MIVSSLIGQSLIAKEKVWVGLSFNITWGVFFIFLVDYFVIGSQMGVEGYSYAYLFSYMILMIINVIYHKIKK